VAEPLAATRTSFAIPLSTGTSGEGLFLSPSSLVSGSMGRQVGKHTWVGVCWQCIGSLWQSHSELRPVALLLQSSWNLLGERAQVSKSKPCGRDTLHKAFQEWARTSRAQSACELASRLYALGRDAFLGSWPGNLDGTL
jgi:hypothetical protein